MAIGADSMYSSERASMREGATQGDEKKTERSDNKEY